MTARQWVRVLDKFLDQIGNNDDGQPQWLYPVAVAFRNAMNEEARLEPFPSQESKQ